LFANPSRKHPTLGLAGGYGIAAALGVVLFWGFTVDDALVTARVAWRLANGGGYRFNASGPAVDAVTPLGWVFLLVPFAARSPMVALEVARYLGAVAWVAAATWVGHLHAREERRNGLAVLFLAAAPLGAWSSAGMETGFVLALCSFALSDSAVALLAAGLAAALRPELLPFCTVLGLRHGWIRRYSRWSWFCGLVPLGACAVTAAVRLIAFGTAVPLAVIAKPSDLTHGLRYTIGALVLTGPAWALVGGGWVGLDAKARWFVAAVTLHFAAMVLAGGDWMPLWRLAVPVLPALVWVATALTARRRKLWHSAGALVGLLVAAVVAWKVGLPGRKVMRAREELIERAAPLLRETRLVAGLDIGWLGIATPHDVLDLAGITDYRVASLPGGHTTKKIPNSWFDFRRPDTLVLLSAPGASLARRWWQTPFARGVENRVARLEYWQNCSARGTVALPNTRQFYVIVGCP